MTDLSKTIAPKSDQLNADDLIAGPRTITVTRVSADPSSSEQPVSISFEGDNGKPYKPCKSMRRVMVHIWGKDGSAYAGRSMTLYRDQEVQFGGMKVGGIRISHMSGMDKAETMALTATRANRKPFTVHPLRIVDHLPAAREEARKGSAAMRAWWVAHPEAHDQANTILAELKRIAAEADSASEGQDEPALTPDQLAAQEAAFAELQRQQEEEK